MEGKQKDGRYERWLVRAAAAYRRMFDDKSQEELVTFTDREGVERLTRRGCAEVSPASAGKDL